MGRPTHCHEHTLDRPICRICSAEKKKRSGCCRNTVQLLSVLVGGGPVVSVLL